MSTAEQMGVPVMRVPISLPCQARVRPGTPDTSGPIEERPEYCAVDAFWMIGKAMICDLHLHELAPEQHDQWLADLEADGWADARTEWTQTPWAERHRYSQDMAAPAA